MRPCCLLQWSNHHINNVEIGCQRITHVGSGNTSCSSGTVCLLRKHLFSPVSLSFIGRQTVRVLVASRCGRDNTSLPRYRTLIRVTCVVSGVSASPEMREPAGSVALPVGHAQRDGTTRNGWRARFATYSMSVYAPPQSLITMI